MTYQSNGVAMSYAFRHKNFPGDPREKGGNRRDGPGSRLSHGEEGLEGLPSAEPTPPRLRTPVETESTAIPFHAST